MKLNITLEDLSMLSQEQRNALRCLWLPQKYDHAVAFICTNIKSDKIDRIEFVVGDVLAQKIYSKRESKVRKYTEIYDGYDVTLRSLRLVSDDFKDDEDINGYEYFRPEDFFNLEYCLPLLNIGQLIKILEELGYKSSNYSISFNTNTKMYLLERHQSNYTDESFESDGLCDVLWNRLKGFLG